MVPPESLFGVIPTWVGVFAISLFGFGLAGLILYLRVIRLTLLGRPADRFDQPVRRVLGAIPLMFGQSKVLHKGGPVKSGAV